jgi:hypothetical protein
MQATEVARLVLMVLIATCALIAFVVNLVLPRNANVWLAPHQFSMHAYEPHISTSMQFTGPFMSQVHVLPSGTTTSEVLAEARRLMGARLGLGAPWEATHGASSPSGR